MSAPPSARHPMIQPVGRNGVMTTHLVQSSADPIPNRDGPTGPGRQTARMQARRSVLAQHDLGRATSGVVTGVARMFAEVHTRRTRAHLKIIRRRTRTAPPANHALPTAAILTNPERARNHARTTPDRAPTGKPNVLRDRRSAPGLTPDRNQKPDRPARPSAIGHAAEMNVMSERIRNDAPTRCAGPTAPRLT